MVFLPDFLSDSLIAHIIEIQNPNTQQTNQKKPVRKNRQLEGFGIQGNTSRKHSLTGRKTEIQTGLHNLLYP